MTRNASAVQENEHLLLAALLENNDGLVLLFDRLKLHDFQRESHKRIYEVIVSLFSDSQTISADSIRAKLKKTEDRATLAVIEKKSFGIVKDSIEVFYEAVKRESQLARIIHAGHRLVEIASEEDASAEEALSMAEQEIIQTVESSVTSKITSAQDAADAFFEHLENKKNGKATKDIYVGLPRVDAMLQGLQPGELITVLGKTGHGKSLFSMQIALYNMINQNTPCLIFSLEMNKLVLMARIFSHLSNLPMNVIRSNEALTDSNRDKFKQGMEQIRKLPLFICDNTYLSSFEIQSLSKKLKIQHKDLGLIIVDYIGLVKGDARGTREQEVSGITRSLKCLAMNLELPVIALSQVNRNFAGRADGEIQIGDARDSGAVENDSDAVISVSMENEDENTNIRPAKISIIKQRSGPIGSIECVCIGSKQKFVDCNIGDYFDE